MSQTLQIMKMGEQIAELEQENNKLLDVINNQDVKIADLEKENAELKHNKKTVVHLADCLEEKMKDKIADLENTCKDKDRQLDNWYKEWQKQDKQIEQAKKLLNAFLDFESVCMENGIKIADDIREQAEQFLKETGNDNPTN